MFLKRFVKLLRPATPWIRKNDQGQILDSKINMTETIKLEKMGNSNEQPKTVVINFNHSFTEEPVIL
jgi:hypothetical protein